MSILENMDEDLKRKIIWLIGIIIFIIGILCFIGVKSFDKRKMEQVATVERVTSQYEVTKVKGPSPFYISVKNTETGEVYNDSFVSSDCPLYDTKAQIGTKVKLTRFTNIGIETGQKTYFFKGAYEQLCTNLSFNPQSGANYYQQ